MTASCRLFALVLLGWALLLIPSEPADVAWPLSVGWLAYVFPRVWRYLTGRFVIYRLTRPRRIKEHA